MDLTIDDRARLLPLLRSAIADARACLSSGFVRRPRPVMSTPEDLADSLEWGEDLLRRLEQMDEA